MIIRAKTKYLFQGKPLTQIQEANSKLNLNELEQKKTVLESYPRRLVFELTNACNLNCVMCGRNAASFKKTAFDMQTFYSFEPLMDIVEEVTLMGWGEPTIHPNFIEMLQVIHKHSARKYFCTNGMNLHKIKQALFDCEVDVFAVSIDGATQESNAKIRRGSDLGFITQNLKEIVQERKRRNVLYPYINFVFCAMRSNLHELPDLVRLAGEIGIEEVKVVYLTVFSDDVLNESLWGYEDEVKQVFEEALKIGEELNVTLKLPHICGTDPAGEKKHKDCYVAWRDFFLGSDGFVRPCMSTPLQFFQYDRTRDFKSLWNAPEYQEFRTKVNDEQAMDSACARCYQSSHCNWNRKQSFLQVGETFSPDWGTK